MEKVIKFPKEKSSLISTLLMANEREDFQKIVKYKDEILDSFDILQNARIFEILLQAYFYLGGFEEVVIIGDELLKKGYESYEVYTYILSSLVACLDIYKALSTIANSKLLNQEEIKYLYDSESANYSNILVLPNDNYYEIVPCLIIVNYITEVAKDMAGSMKIDRDYLLFKFFDLINMIYELGFDEVILSKMEDILRAAFEIDI